MASRSTLIILLPLCLFYSTNSSGQGLPSGGSSGEGSRIEGKFKFMPIPYVNYDRSIGFSIGAIPMGMFNPVKKDTISPSSVLGLLGIYSSNKTWFAMAFGAFYLQQDNWRLQFAGGVGNINFQFYLDNPINQWIPYNTQADFAYVAVSRRIVDRLYFGVSYIYTAFQTNTEVFTDSLETQLNGIGLELSFDKRKNLYYPRSGYITNANYFTYLKGFGNEFVSNKIDLDYNHYFAVRKDNDVVAARFYAGIGIGDLTFNQQYIVGQTDIRGYTQGAFRGNYLMSLQGEYRWNFHKKIGIVGFLGFATVFEAINASDDGRILPGVGTGFRYVVFKDTHMNAGMDIAVGVDDWGVYFRVGEAF